MENKEILRIEADIARRKKRTIIFSTLLTIAIFSLFILELWDTYSSMLRIITDIDSNLSEGFERRGIVALIVFILLFVLALIWFQVVINRIYETERIHRIKWAQELTQETP